MTLRKYLSEIGINMQAQTLALLQQDGFSTLPPDAGPFHLYMVLQRPRIALDPSSVVFSNTSVQGRFSIQKQNTLEHYDFVGFNGLGTSNVRLECNYPHTEFKVRDANGNVLSSGKVANLIANMSTKFWNHMDLEVLYVGQSYGEAGSREAPTRLASHSTLQSIYAEAIRAAPDKEVWLLLLQFGEMRLVSFDGRSQQLGTTPDQDVAHFKEAMAAELTEQQKINFTEAALIKYFQPRFNEIYKNTFPSPAHSTYSQCYDIDLNSVSFEIETESIKGRLWSTAAPPSWLHIGTFPLHSTEERKSMFDFFK